MRGAEALSPTPLAPAADGARRARRKAGQRLSHYGAEGAVHMVDVTAKSPTRREARARASVRMSREVLRQLAENPKGNPLEVARIAGIAAAKRTWELIPLCHPIPLGAIEVEAALGAEGVELTSLVATTAATGVEMEALTAVAVAALTVYDMCKALDKAIEIREVVLLSKRGGKSGDFRRRSIGAPRPLAGAPPIGQR